MCAIGEADEVGKGVQVGVANTPNHAKTCYVDQANGSSSVAFGVRGGHHASSSKSIFLEHGLLYSLDVKNIENS